MKLVLLLFLLSGEAVENISLRLSVEANLWRFA
jgi:hypothetical protein